MHFEQLLDPPKISRTCLPDAIERDPSVRPTKIWIRARPEKFIDDFRVSGGDGHVEG
jgi:hypothetical protein